MIPEQRLREIAAVEPMAGDHVVRERWTMAAELLAARKELAKQRRHINRPQYEAMQKERDDANAALRRMTNTHAAVVADRDAALLILPACCGSLADAADTLRQERDAARAENERLAKHIADLRTWAEKWSKDEERESYERRGVWRLVARQIDMLTEQPKPAGGGA